MSFKRDLESVLNKHGKDNDLNIPDYILAKYISKCINNLKRLIDSTEYHKS